MEIVITEIRGDTESVIILRKRIETELDKGNTVKIQLLQPGVMYKQDGIYHTVVEFMNEWIGKPVSFMSNLVPLAEVKVPFEYSNDMFFSGPKLYQKNKKCIELASKLKSVEQKDTNKYWDLLLGEASNNKDILHNAITNHSVLDKTFLTYFGKDTTKGYWSDDVVRPKKHTAETLGPLANRFNTQIRCSDLFDPAIYNSTHYTAMIETTIHNDFAMFSEKEAKPIIAQRPFIIFGVKDQLKAFKSLGFKTFDSVIDESYDVIDDKVQRWNKALDSMMTLTEKDPIEVYATLKDVLAYNKDHFENSDWKRCLTWDSYQ
jgi:hypothetical protein